MEALSLSLLSCFFLAHILGITTEDQYEKVDRFGKQIWFHRDATHPGICQNKKEMGFCNQKGQTKTTTSWQFFVPFLGWLSDLSKVKWPRTRG